MKFAICIPKELFPQLKKIPGLLNEAGRIDECDLQKITEPHLQEAITFLPVDIESELSAILFLMRFHPDLQLLCLRKEL